MNMEIFVKDFSGTALPRSLKFGTNIRYDKLDIDIDIEDLFSVQ